MPGQGPMVLGVRGRSLRLSRKLACFKLDGRGAAEGGGLVSRVLNK